MKKDVKLYYEEFAALVYRYLYRLCHNADLAEELTQETFYQALRTVAQYRGECKPSVWLCQIARYSWYKYLNKNKIYANYETLDETIVDNKKGPLAEIIEQEEKATLYEQIKKLKPAVQEVMLLRIMEELSFQEIGFIVGKSENWARVTFYRGKEEVKKGVSK